jgi:hypothetical protein
MSAITASEDHCEVVALSDLVTGPQQHSARKAAEPVMAALGD